MQTQAVVPTPRRRIATPERWQAALKRALADGLQVRQLSGSGQWIATSGTRDGVAYETDGRDCTCEAAMLGGDPVCKHRALYWHRQGMLDLDPEPEPPAPANVIPFRRPARADDTQRDGEQATADRAIALIERMAARAADEPCDLRIAA
ncbi:MAG: hypothetical protein ACRDJW_04650 [Thermomicrobiales bacterium]